jgi:hypothetical protein
MIKEGGFTSGYLIYRMLPPNAAGHFIVICLFRVHDGQLVSFHEIFHADGTVGNVTAKHNAQHRVTVRKGGGADEYIYCRTGQLLQNSTGKGVVLRQF